MNHPIKKENMLELARYQQHLCTFPRLKYLFLELTDRCNLSCRHCGSSCTANNHTYLPFEKIQEVLLQVAEAYDARDIMICITGASRSCIRIYMTSYDMQENAALLPELHQTER